MWGSSVVSLPCFPATREWKMAIMLMKTTCPAHRHLEYSHQSFQGCCRYNELIGGVFFIIDRYLMPPPYLAADAPVSNIVHPVEIEFVEAFGYKLDAAVFYHFDGLLGQCFHVHKPLVRQVGFYDCFASVACANTIVVSVCFDQCALIFKFY